MILKCHEYTRRSCLEDRFCAVYAWDKNKKRSGTLDNLNIIIVITYDFSAIIKKIKINTS